MNELKAGDELIFRNGHGYKRHPITHITKSGRIKCRGLTLNPDLSIRDSLKYEQVWSVVVATPDAIAQMEEYERRDKLLFQLKGVYFPNLKIEQLQKIAEVIFPNEGE